MLTDADLCQLAARAYTTAPTWEAGDVRAVLTDFAGWSVVAFRGTDPCDLRDWLRDLDAWPCWRFGLGFCHRGFLRGGELMLAPLLRQAETRRLILTGHSLGGALALAVGALLARRHLPPARIVTFAAPRVGLWRFRLALRRVHVRQYHLAGDVVPDVPWPYRHVRRPIRLVPEIFDPLAAHAVAAYATRVSTLKDIP